MIAILYSTARVSQRIRVGLLRSYCQKIDDLVSGSVEIGRIAEGGAHEVTLEHISVEDVRWLNDVTAEQIEVSEKFFKGLMKHINEYMKRYEGEIGKIRMAATQRAYERQLKRPLAEKLALPLQVEIPVDAPIEVKILVTSHLKALAAKIADEIDVTNDRMGITINFGMPWDDREAFLFLLWKEYGKHRGWRAFDGYVADARLAFIDAVELPKEVA